MGEMSHLLYSFSIQILATYEPHAPAPVETDLYLSLAGTMLNQLHPPNYIFQY